jgi:hypothetical protein
MLYNPTKHNTINQRKEYNADIGITSSLQRTTTRKP